MAFHLLVGVLKIKICLNWFQVGRTIIADRMHPIGHGYAGQLSVYLILDDILKRIDVLIIRIEPKTIGFRLQDHGHSMMDRPYRLAGFPGQDRTGSIGRLLSFVIPGFP